MGEPCQNLRWKKRGCWGLTTNQQAKIYRCRWDKKKKSFSHRSIYSHSIHKYKQNKEDVHNNQLQPFTALLTETSHDLGPCRDRKRTIKRCLGTVAYTDLFPWVSLVGNLISLQFLIVYHKGAACSQWRTDRGKEAPAVLHDACCCISTDCSVFLMKLHFVLGGWWGEHRRRSEARQSVSCLKMSKLWWKLSSVIRRSKNAQSANTFSALLQGTSSKSACC